MPILPLILPEELGVTIEQIFHPVDPAAVPEIAGVLDWLAKHDPDVLGAVAEVDRGLIWATMELTPRDRLHQGVQIGLDLDELAENLRQQRAVERTA